MQIHRSIPAVLCALLVFTLDARAATDAANAKALRSNLPAEITLARATIPQTAAALHEAVLQHHDDALDLLRVAVLAKTPKQGDGRLPCPDLRRLVQAACTAAPDKTSQLVELANTLDPDCAAILQDLPGATGNASGAGSDGFGFGIGFGPGIIGAPEFTRATITGSAGFSPLPPASPPPVTPTTND